MGKGYERTVRMRVVAKKEGGGDKVQGCIKPAGNWVHKERYTTVQ